MLKKFRAPCKTWIITKSLYTNEFTNNLILYISKKRIFFFLYKEICQAFWKGRLNLIEKTQLAANVRRQARRENKSRSIENPWKLFLHAFSLIKPWNFLIDPLFKVLGCEVADNEPTDRSMLVIFWNFAFCANYKQKSS